MDEKCPECGEVEFVSGTFGDFARIGKTPRKTLRNPSSEVIAKICVGCGLILKLTVVDPQKLK